MSLTKLDDTNLFNDDLNHVVEILFFFLSVRGDSNHY